MIADLRLVDQQASNLPSGEDVVCRSLKVWADDHVVCFDIKSQEDARHTMSAASKALFTHGLKKTT
jgi:hypothetical protein